MHNALGFTLNTSGSGAVLTVDLKLRDTGDWTNDEGLSCWTVPHLYNVTSVFRTSTCIQNIYNMQFMPI